MLSAIIIFLLILTVPAGILLIMRYINDALDSWEIGDEVQGRRDTNYTCYKKDTYKLYNNTTKLSRTSPPKACFFGRLEGQEFNIEGPPEEKYMTATELSAWKNKNNTIENKPIGFTAKNFSPYANLPINMRKHLDRDYPGYIYNKKEEKDDQEIHNKSS